MVVLQTWWYFKHPVIEGSVHPISVLELTKKNEVVDPFRLLLVLGYYFPWGTPLTFPDFVRDIMHCEAVDEGNQLLGIVRPIVRRC